MDDDYPVEVTITSTPEEGTTCTRSRAQGGCEEQDGLGVQVFQEGDQERQKKKWVSVFVV